MHAFNEALRVPPDQHSAMETHGICAIIDEDGEFFDVLPEQTLVMYDGDIIHQCAVVGVVERPMRVLIIQSYRRDLRY